MEQLLQKIEQYKNEIKESIAESKDEVEAFRIKYLGTKGLVKTIMGEMKNIAADQKREAGQLLNEFKVFVEEKFEGLKTASGSDLQEDAFAEIRYFNYDYRSLVTLPIIL